MIAKPSIYVIKLKRNLLPMLFLGFTFCLLIFSKSNLPAVKSGLQLWATSVIPSLFPFFVATELLMHTNIVTLLRKPIDASYETCFQRARRRCFCFYYGDY